MRRALLLSVALLMTALPEGARATLPDCPPQPPRDWSQVTTNTRTQPVQWSAHRGGVNLGPQQTAEAYRAAIGFGATQVEVDLRLSKDGQFVVAHDEAPASVGVPEAERRPITEMTAEEYTTTLNAAVGPWTGTEFDPARYMTFADVLALAAPTGTGLDIEFKDIGAERHRIREVAQAVADAGVMSKTIWQHGLETDVVALVRSVDPDARFNYNIGDEPPAFLYQQAVTTDYSFGSTLAEFTPDKIAAIHDGCGVVLPHSYDGLNDRDPSAPETAREHDQMVAGLALGVDGFQTNRPDAAADALDQPAPSELVRSGGQVCLVNATNGMPLPGRTLTVGKSTAQTGMGGCVPAKRHARVQYEGDGSALAAPPLDHRT